MTPEARWQALTEHCLQHGVNATVAAEASTAALERALPILERLDKAEQLRQAEAMAKAEERGRQAAKVEAEEKIAEAKSQLQAAEAAAAAAKRREKWLAVGSSAASALLAVLIAYVAMRLGVEP